MRIAYLLLAHRQPRQLARLLDALVGPPAAHDGARRDHVFVHVDARRDAASFHDAFATLPRTDDTRRVHWLADRVPVRWGGFSVVEATLALLRTAAAHGALFDRYVLLSGADYPIQPPALTRERLGTPVEFITVEELLHARHPSAEARSRVTRPHFLDVRWLNPMDSPAPALTARIDRLLARLPRLARPALPTRKGSQWWALTGDCVAYVLRYVDAHPGHVRFHRRALVPDESFFHSIVAESPFADRIWHDATRSEEGRPGTPNVLGAHFIDWSDPNASSPRVLTADDFEALQQSSALFARKFDERASAVLLDRLDAFRSAASR
jgi:hypothetical protein